MSARPTNHAITDTNVLLDIHSCHDLAQTYEAARTQGSKAIEAPAVKYRLSRARESVLLAIHFHETAATTLGLHGELVELLTRRAPPAPAGQTIESDFTTFFLHFVKDYVLPAWTPSVPTQPGKDAGNAADVALIDLAQTGNVPLITNEGHTPEGIIDQGLRKLARQRGVVVFVPREFYAGKLDETQAIERFLQRFHDQAPGYLHSRRVEFGEDDNGAAALEWIYGYYRMVLRSEFAAP